MKKNILTFLILGILLLLVGCEEVEPQPTLNLPVKVDFSAYEQRDPNDPLYTRLSPEPLRELIPSEDYGTLYPFIGARRSYLIEDEYEGLTKSYYGFTDATGRIIVDPVYYLIEMLDTGTYYNSPCLPFWDITEECRMPDYPDVPYYRHALAAIDGSFVTDFIYSEIEGYEDCIIAARMNPRTDGYDVFSHNGELLFSTTELPYPVEDVFRFSSCENGLFLLWMDHGAYSSVYYYVDWEGRIRSGPYEKASKFPCGWARVKLLTGEYTYIDSAGTSIGRTFSYCSHFTDGYAVVITENQSEVIVQTGATLFTFPKYGTDPILYVTEGGFLIQDSGSDYLYSFNGQLLYSSESDLWSPSKSIYLCDSDPNAPYLYHVGLEKTIFLPPMSKNCQICIDLVPNTFDSFITLKYLTRSDSTLYIYSKDLTLLAIEDEDRPKLLWEQPGKDRDNCLSLPGKAGTELYHPDGTLLGLSPMSDFTSGRIGPKGYITLTNNTCTKIYDSQGTLIFCYPLIQNLDD